MATISQIRHIHTLKTRLGLDDDLYRYMLLSFGVGSSKNLTTAEAAILIDILIHKAVAKGVYEKQAKKYDEFDFRDDDFATPSQMRMIEGIWNEICTKSDPKSALRQFLQNKFKVADIRFLTKTKASKVIQVLHIIKNRKKSAQKRCGSTTQ
jgi:hypothetical protein